MIRSPGNIKMAVEALKGAKWRSLLTMLGIVIGIVSVVTTISLGEGAKRQIVNQIRKSGSDLITIKPASIKGRNTEGLLKSEFNGSLSDRDLTMIQASNSLKEVVPFAYVTNNASAGGINYDSGAVIGTSQYLPAALNQKIDYGAFFSDSDEYSQNTAIIGKRVAEQLFGENVPVGKIMTIRGQEFAVGGIFAEFDTSPLSTSFDYNKAIFIPYQRAKNLNDNAPNIYQIAVRPNDQKQVSSSVSAIDKILAGSHMGQSDYQILTQKEALAQADSIFNLMTGFVSGIAAISLLVGGIGILNIMLVSVTERTHEIGLRKAVGATNGQILGQFLTESIILSFGGGLLGILGSLLAMYFFRVFSDFKPVLTWQAMVLATGVAIIVGIVFGVTPALKAARKSPIDALRHQ